MSGEKPTPPGNTMPWLGPAALVSLQRNNANDARCVSWILKNITDPEALDTAVRLAGTVRWFEDRIDTEVPYDFIVSTFHECFGSDGEVRPGLWDRAYNSGRAMLWINILAMCKSAEFARRFPLQTIKYTSPDFDDDLSGLLEVCKASSVCCRLVHLLVIRSGFTPMHIRWVSNTLLHLSWVHQATSGTLDNSDMIVLFIHQPQPTTIPLDTVTILNRLLTWCNLLDSAVKEEVLKVHDKSCDTSCFCFFSCLHLVHQ